MEKLSDHPIIRTSDHPIIRISAVALVLWLIPFVSVFPQSDTLKVLLNQVEIVSPKESENLTSQPLSATQISSEEMENRQMTSLKGLSNIVPGFFMPDYGSRLTSAIYIRGVGSRINTPAVGLYVDNVPYFDKSAFDFNFYDIESIEILRGPQGTLYGRNTMGGLIKVQTKNPFAYQGTLVKLGYSTGDNHRSLSFTHYHKPSNHFAFSAGGYYEAGNGFFKNDVTGHHIDDIQAGGGRLRALFFAKDNLKFDCSLGYDYSDEGAYPYYYTGQLSGDEENEDCLDKITNNRENRYRRGMFNGGVSIQYTPAKYVLTLTTGFQNINDRMFLDQDFIRKDIYTIEQKQKLSILSEEITIRSSKTNAQRPTTNDQRPTTKDQRPTTTAQYDWLFGAVGSYQWLKTNGPVTFYEDGRKELVEDNVNTIFTDLKASNPRMPDMYLNVTDNSFQVTSDMNTPMLSAALFHQSELKFSDWTVIAGLRLEYEKTHLDYLSQCPLNYEFTVSMPPYMNKTFSPLTVSPLFDGTMDKDYLQLLPKLAVRYSFNHQNHQNHQNPQNHHNHHNPQNSQNPHNSSFIYASVSKGYRSGGYNVQMFSDIVKGEMKNQMIDQVNEVSDGMMARFVDIDAVKTPTSVDGVVYSPEYSWNYELGTTITFPTPLTSNPQNPQNSLNLSPLTSLHAAVYYIRTYDQQIARFASSGLGRMMVNAGRSESYGAEIEASSRIFLIDTHLSYGYTHATFTQYNDGENDYTDNFVPFVPMHTLNLTLAHTFNLSTPQNHSEVSIPAQFNCANPQNHLTLGLDFSGAGRVYWTEANNAYENFCPTLGAFISFRLGQSSWMKTIGMKSMSLTLWGKNLTKANYNTFYFESAGRCYSQHAKPIRIGINLNCEL